MASKDDNSKKVRKNGTRGDRLAAALRENLRRRKAQQRSREADPPPRGESTADLETYISGEGPISEHK
jgi:hypothetical protein